MLCGYRWGVDVVFWWWVVLRKTRLVLVRGKPAAHTQAQKEPKQFRSW